MRKNIVKIVIALFIFCFASNIYAAQIVSITFSKKISKSFEPLEITDVFYPDSPIIHCIVGIKNAKRGTVVKGEWVSVDAISTPNYVIDSANVKLPGESANVHFSITKPNKGWPIGNYKLKIYINNTYVTYAPFKIIAKKTVESFLQAPQKKPNKHKIIDSLNKARTKRQNPIAAQINQYNKNILGKWSCIMKYMGQNVGSGLLHFGKNGNAVINGQNFKYTLERGNILKVYKNSIISKYKYSFQGNNLKLVYNDGSFFYCQRASSPSPYSKERIKNKTERYAKKQNYAQSYNQQYAEQHNNNYAQSYNRQYAQQHNDTYAQSYNQQYAQQHNNNYAQSYNQQYAQRQNNNQRYAQNMNSGQNWQLQGSYCTWSGSSYGSSSYSHTKYINFDGNGRWTFGESSSYSGSGGMYAGQGSDNSGTYQVKGDIIYYTTDSGERGSAQVYVRQNSGMITEIKVDGQLYAKSLCN